MTSQGVNYIVKIILSDRGRIAYVHDGNNPLPMTENDKCVIVK